MHLDVGLLVLVAGLVLCVDVNRVVLVTNRGQMESLNRRTPLWRATLLFAAHSMG